MRTKHVKIQFRIVFLSLSGAFGAVYSENPKFISLRHRPPGSRLQFLPCPVSGNRASDINSNCWRGPCWHKAILRLGWNPLSGLGAGHWAVKLQPSLSEQHGGPQDAARRPWLAPRRLPVARTSPAAMRSVHSAPGRGRVGCAVTHAPRAPCCRGSPTI